MVWLDLILFQLAVHAHLFSPIAHRTGLYICNHAVALQRANNIFTTFAFQLYPCSNGIFISWISSVRQNSLPARARLRAQMSACQNVPRVF